MSSPPPPFFIKLLEPEIRCWVLYRLNSFVPPPPSSNEVKKNVPTGLFLVHRFAYGREDGLIFTTGIHVSANDTTLCWNGVQIAKSCLGRCRHVNLCLLLFKSYHYIAQLHHIHFWFCSHLLMLIIYYRIFPVIALDNDCVRSYNEAKKHLQMSLAKLPHTGQSSLRRVCSYDNTFLDVPTYNSIHA